MNKLHQYPDKGLRELEGSLEEQEARFKKLSKEFWARMREQFKGINV